MVRWKWLCFRALSFFNKWNNRSMMRWKFAVLVSGMLAARGIIEAWCDGNLQEYKQRTGTTRGIIEA
ncbi:hypothetical protein DVR12_01495 [Chitinophaga silvatica]|uniref:Uncharacterized protein n=1 Tax=Chitinophaga silvatica TaxID=2282649 RepID=A0A3E1YH02_9BACT|nr:hypothetical protein DVR12_01495 [Chitinophaga silvatica]